MSIGLRLTVDFGFLAIVGDDVKMIVEILEKVITSTKLKVLRLVSPDKRAKDMSERYLLKLRSAFRPPPLALSKMRNSISSITSFPGFEPRIPLTSLREFIHYELLPSFEGGHEAIVQSSVDFHQGAIAVDIKKKLLPAMKELLKDGMKIQTLQAWGWFIRLLGPCAMKNRHLVNEMLKIPEQTFSDVNPQVQIASQVAWEGAIDALFHPSPKTPKTKTAMEHNSQQLRRSKGIDSENEADGLLKRIKLIMTPLIGIMSSKCDVSVHSSCLNTWCYLLHKLDTSIIHPHGSMEMVTPETKRFSCNDALRIFRSVLKGVQHIVKSSSITYNEIMSCLNTILMFLKKVCEDYDSEDSGINDLCQTSLQFVEVATEELEPSILGSPLYKVALDLQYIDNLESVNEFRPARSLGICSADMNMVPPILYLAKLYFCVVVKLISKASITESIPQGIHRYFRNLLHSFDPTEILYAFVSLLYRHSVTDCLFLWRIIANCLRDYIASSIKNLSLLKTESDNSGYVVVCHFLCHPFAVYSCPKRQLTPMKTSGSLELSFVTSESQRKLELGHVIEVWKSLYVSVSSASKFECSSSNSFSEDLSSMVNKCLNGKRSALESGTELEKDNCGLSFCGHIVIFVLVQILKSDICCKGSRHGSDAIYSSFSSVKNSLGFTARFLSMSWTKAATHPPTDLQVTSRVFTILVRFVSCLYFKEDIVSFIEIVSSPLLQWLSYAEAQNENIGHQIKLDYPQSLLPVLDKLSRSGKIGLCKRGQQISGKGHAKEDAIAASQGCKVTARLNRTFKRVELVEDTLDGFQKGEKPPSRPKRKGLELTKHQKEVRRAQQGRASDCDGRGPGIRTYTSVDFSQGNEESQESQEIRNAESILEMLKRDGKLS
ncbi:hypothetical protein RJ639_027188 [Escallonia herrerae]|uniref:Telomere-associated protein Rif1 N-terminal domain-containing protein n=1 Tax=Escallonia herrerae TaxID=1293975 RepID=A0AA88XAU1_9ASTE|nr:hypothetical protein RJ639_027188 [Escallonia herrerae]